MIPTTRITVIGSGYVGLTTGACLASLGHAVTCVDHNPATVEALRNGRTHLAEPDMNNLVRQGLSDGLLQFDTAADSVHRLPAPVEEQLQDRKVRRAQAQGLDAAARVSLQGPMGLHQDQPQVHSG